MAYGTLKCDNIVFDNGGVDKLITVSGLFYSTSGALTVTGTISGGSVTAPTATFTTLTGTTTAGTTATFTSGSFTSLTGVTTTVTSGIFGLGTAAAPSITISGDLNTGIYSPGADQLAISTNGTGRITVDASGNVNIDSNTLYVDAANNRVGIGSPAPQALLDVSASTGTRIRSTYTATTGPRDAGFEIFGDGAANSSFVYAGNTGVTTISSLLGTALNIGGTEALRVDSSRRLLVGTSTSAGTNALFQVRSDSAIAFEAFQSANNTGGSNLILSKSRGTAAAPTVVSSGDFLGIIRFRGHDGTDYDTSAAEIAVQVDGTPGANDMPGRLVFSTTADGAASPTERMRIDNIGTTTLTSAASTAPFIAKISSTEVARIDSSGRLLVGISSAVSTINYAGGDRTPRLQVVGDDTSNGSFAIIRTQTAPSLFFAGGASGTNVSSGNGIGSIVFTGYHTTKYYTGAAITAEVDGTPGANDMPGRLVFSTTADGAASPTGRLRISSTGLFVAFSSNTDCFRIHTSAAASTSDNLLLGRYGSTGFDDGATSLIIRSNGNILNTNNSYGAISDLKLKENIVDATSQWDDLKAFQVRNYNFKEGQTHTQIGLVAQEVELVSPGLVSESPDRDDEGNDLGTVTKSINYSVLYMKAVKALQEAMERIETLEASNADMLARVTALEAE